MLKQQTILKAENLYYFSLGLLLASLPLSKFCMSVSQFMLLGCWIVAGLEARAEQPLSAGRDLRGQHIKSYFQAILRNMGNKLMEAFHNKVVLASVSIYLLFVAGLLFTSDFNYAFNDLRNKLPLFILPVIISTGPRINEKLLSRFLVVYLTAILVSAVYQWVLLHHSGKTDIREVNTHLSHIRYSMNAVYGIAVSLYLILDHRVNNRFLRFVILVNALFIALFLFFMGYKTGIVLLGVLACACFVRWMAVKLSKLQSFVILCIALISIGLCSWFIYQKVTYRPGRVSFKTLDKYTVNGNRYYHDTIHYPVENGQYTGLYISYEELKEAWARRSGDSINGLDEKQQPLRVTLIRYLASCDLRKDSVGVSRLSDEDIRNIEKGEANRRLLQKFHANAYLDDFLRAWHDYREHDYPNGNSIIQRLEYWKTATRIIRSHWLTGTGTGDVADAFTQQYTKDQTHLLPKYRLRAHNQYLTVLLTLGVFGFLCFMFLILYPGISTRKFKNWYYLAFMLIMLISMLTEDTLESQEGITFFACMSALLLFGDTVEKGRRKEEISMNTL